MEEEEDRSQDWDPRFLRACAIDMHLDVSQKPFMRKFTGNAGPKSAAQTLCEPAQSKCMWSYHNALEQLEHPDQAPAFTLAVRTPKCGYEARGKPGKP